MVVIGQPKKIRVQFLDTVSKESKTFTINGLELQDLYDKVSDFVKKLVQYETIKILYYTTKEDKNAKKTIRWKRKKSNQ